MKIKTGIYNEQFYLRVTSEAGSFFKLYNTEQETLEAIQQVKDKFEKMSESIERLRKAV